MGFSTRRLVLSLAFCYFVLVFFSPFSIAITSLGEERANLGAFGALVRCVLVWFCLFPVLPFFTGTFIATPSPEKKIAYKTFFVHKERLAIIGRLLCLVAQILLLTFLTGSK